MGVFSWARYGGLGLNVDAASDVLRGWGYRGISLIRNTHPQRITIGL